MTALMLASMALEILLLLVLLIHSRRHVRRSFPGQDPGGASLESGAWQTCPRVALVVPLTGNSLEMEVLSPPFLKGDLGGRSIAYLITPCPPLEKGGNSFPT